MRTNGGRINRRGYRRGYTDEEKAKIVAAIERAFEKSGRFDEMRDLERSDLCEQFGVSLTSYYRWGGKTPKHYHPRGDRRVPPPMPPPDHSKFVEPKVARDPWFVRFARWVCGVGS